VVVIGATLTVGNSVNSKVEGWGSTIVVLCWSKVVLVVLKVVLGWSVVVTPVVLKVVLGGSVAKLVFFMHYKPTREVPFTQMNGHKSVYPPSPAHSAFPGR
jgi:hypothetical protein